MSGKTLDEFCEKFDKSLVTINKIKEGLAQLGDAWEYEIEFLKRCSLSVTDLAREREEFSDYYVIVPAKPPKRIWAGTKEFAEKLRAKV